MEEGGGETGIGKDLLYVTTRHDHFTAFII